MDENLSAAVQEVFIRLYEKGLIYRGDRIINWCPGCHTALSDAEVEYTEKDSFLWHIRYPVKDSDKYVVIATTRPETLLGDTAVAVNPKDERYKDILGKTLILPIVGREIPLIADDYCEIGFGTGAVKITPAHDPNDFEVGLRHNLDVIRVMDDSGIMNENAGKYQGLTRDECRQQIVEDLKEQGFLVKIEPYKHNVGECYRCKNVVEPMVSKQWFVSMKPLAKPAIKAVKSKRIEFIPTRFEKSTSTGWKTSKTGVFPVNSGGDIVSPRITAKNAAKWLSQRKCPRSARSAAALISSRTKTFLTPGFPARCGRSRRSVFPEIPKN